jgi:hypothetical protein
VLVRVRYTPYWELTSGSGCVAQASGGLTRVTLARAGTARVAARFAPGRLVSRGPRCRVSA